MNDQYQSFYHNVLHVLKFFLKHNHVQHYQIMHHRLMQKSQYEYDQQSHDKPFYYLDMEPLQAFQSHG